MARDVPSLSLKGWVKDPQPKADRLMSYYFTTNFSQTNLFRNSITSLPKQIQEYGHDIDQLCTVMERQMTAQFSAYFDNVSCRVRSDIPNPLDPTRYNLTVECFVSQDGKSYSLGRLIEVEGNAIKRIMQYNNEGTLR